MEISSRTPPWTRNAGRNIYAIEISTTSAGQDGKGKLFTVFDLNRVVRILPEFDNTECVIYDHKYMKLYPATEFPNMLKKLKREQYDRTWPAYKSRNGYDVFFSLKKYPAREFILTWERAVAFHYS